MEQSFYKRFWLEISLQEAKERFIIRVNENIFKILQKKLWQTNYDELFEELCKKLAINTNDNNIRYNNYITWNYSFKWLENLVNWNFNKIIQLLEKLYYFKDTFFNNIYWFDLNLLINFCLQESINEDWIDLWIIFINWKFLPKWNDKLDKELVEKSIDNLKWLQAEKYYKECLENYLKWNKKWVIEDCFETLEKLSQEILQNEKWLKENKDNLINYLKSNEIFTSYWINIINQLYLYFNDHRHTKNDKTNENIDENEVEATLYLTWLIINLISKSNLITNNK